MPPNEATHDGVCCCIIIVSMIPFVNCITPLIVASVSAENYCTMKKFEEWRKLPANQAATATTGIPSATVACLNYMLTLEKPAKNSPLGVRLTSGGGGIQVEAVTAGSAAEAAGLRVGDKVKTVNAQAVPPSAIQLIEILKAAEAGPIHIAVERFGA